MQFWTSLYPRKALLRNGALSLLLLSILSALATAQAEVNFGGLKEAVESAERSPKFVKRDRYRNPYETLEFLDIQAHHHVVEIWPSGGWYAEILAPYLYAQGRYTGAGFSLDAKRTPAWRKSMQTQLMQRFEQQPQRYGRVQWTALAVPEFTEIAPANSVDRVLTFRNVHNWMKGRYAPAVFAAMYKALKPGGKMGLVEHRAEPGTSWAQMVKSGYVTRAAVVGMAERAGFKLYAEASINSNRRDTKDHPHGVWSLPPSLRGGEPNKQHYLEIGESDRMTLLFIKPED